MHQYAAGELTQFVQPNGKIEYHEFRNFMILANPSGVLHLYGSNNCPCLSLTVRLVCHCVTMG